MPKRSAADAALAAVVPAPRTAPEHSVRSRSGRTVKPRVWDDGTVAAPVAALKEDGSPLPPSKRAHRAEAEDPDFSLQAEEGGHSGEEGRGGSERAHHHHRGHAAAGGGRGGSGHSEEDEAGGHHAYSSDSPRASIDGSQGGGGSMGRARSSSVGRDEHGKFTSGPRPRGARGGRGRGEGGGGIFKMAAVEVLRLEKRLMSTGEIARVALKRGLIKCTGKTPEATMASALYTDIKRKEGRSVFIRPHEGLFGLREWIEQGVAFQDEFAEEMAKRARAAYGAFAGVPGMAPMLPAMVDAEGLPIATPFGPAPTMTFAGMPVPMLPHPHMLPGMHPHAAAAAAAAVSLAPGYHGVKGGGGKGGGACGEDSPDGLMELLCAAEELHKSSSKDSGEGVKQEPEGSPEPASAAAAAGAALECDAADAPQEGAAAEMETDGEADAQQQQQQQRQQPAASGAQQQQQQQPAPAGSVGGGAPADEDTAAAAALAAVAEAAAEEPTSQLQAGPPMAYAPHPYPPYPYAYAPHAFLAPQPPAAAANGGLPPLPKAGARGAAGAGTQADDSLAPAGRAAELAVRGSSRPFGLAGGGVSAGGAAEARGGGQEQVNILNLPLPECQESQGGGHGGGAGGAGAAVAGMLPPGGSALDPAALKEAEAQVMRLEKELGTSHPEVGKAYLSLSRLYLAGCEESASKQLAVAALSRSWEILNVCQLALKRQPSCTSSFSYLMDKIRAAEAAGPGAAAAAAAALAPPTAAAVLATPAGDAATQAAALGPRQITSPAANGEAAHLALAAH